MASAESLRALLRLDHGHHPSSRVTPGPPQPGHSGVLRFSGPARLPQPAPQAQLCQDCHHGEKHFSLTMHRPPTAFLQQILNGFIKI